MLAFIHANYADAICVDAIAASANVSKREAFRSFKQVLGTTPTLYLLQHRVNRAARRLMETSQSITEISSACGFSTPSYFTKVFHDLTAFHGISPIPFIVSRISSSLKINLVIVACSTFPHSVLISLLIT